MKSATGAERFVYLYGIISREQAWPRGASAHLEVIPYSKLLAIVEFVSADEFAPEALEEKLQSAEWVAEQARKHEAVLEAAMEHGPVIPACLCTLFSRIDAVEVSLAENEERFLAVLEHLQGRQEWGLKVFCDETRFRATAGAADPDVRALDATAAITSPGHRYILGKKRDARCAEVAGARIVEAVDEILGVLEPLAFAIRSKPLLPQQATGRCETMTVNWAVLVDVAALDAFHAAVEELASRFSHGGFAFEVSGPWPPCSFCDPDGVAGSMNEAQLGEGTR